MHNYSISKINLVYSVISIMAVTFYTKSRALNESLFAHMHFYKVINFEQSIHCLVWQTWVNNEWSSSAPQTWTVRIHRGRGVWVCVCVWQGISQETELQCINSSSTLTIFFKVAVPAVVAMSKIWRDQYLRACLINRRTRIQVLTKGPGHTNSGLQLVYTGLWC